MSDALEIHLGAGLRTACDKPREGLPVVCDFVPHFEMMKAGRLLAESGWTVCGACDEAHFARLVARSNAPGGSA